MGEILKKIEQTNIYLYSTELKNRNNEKNLGIVLCIGIIGIEGE
jgi:hypothetical protein